MKLVIQRVTYSKVEVDHKIISEIKHGFNILVGFKNDDSKTIIDEMIIKIINLRIFEDNHQKLNLAIKDVAGEILLVPQFTLYADTSTGRRPSFTNAAKAEVALPLFEYFAQQLAKVSSVKTGIFGADMKVTIINDGPVTIIIDS